MILPRAAAEELTDRLFEVRCAAEDIREAVNDGEPADSVLELCRELVDLARAAEGVRGRSE